MTAAQPDVLVVAAYGLILPPPVLEAAPQGALNIHASLLPRWRGAAPDSARASGRRPETGISIMQMDAGLDTGPVLSRHPLAIARDDDAGTLHDKLAALGAEAIVATLADVEAGRASAVPQPASGATYARKIDKRETRLDWTQSASALERAVRAFRPTPGRPRPAPSRAGKDLARARARPPGRAGRCAGCAGRGRHRLRRKGARGIGAAARRRPAVERARVPARPSFAGRRSFRVSALAAALRDAAPMVERVAAGMSLAAEFERLAEGGSETPRAALIDLTHGTLRRYGRVQAIVRQLSRRASGDALVEALLWCSLYALESGRYAEYTVVDQAVRACGLLERWNAKGYVNAVLRGFLRERGLARGAHPGRCRGPLPASALVDRDPARRVSRGRGGGAGGRQFPSADVPAREPPARQRCALSGAAAGSRHRARARWATRRSFSSARCRLSACRDSTAARFRCRTPARSARRTVSISPTASACSMRAPRPAARAAICSSARRSTLTALDADAGALRAARAQSGAPRSPRARVNADCTRLGDWWDGVPFDRVLADVPCSASGHRAAPSGHQVVAPRQRCRGLRRASGRDPRRACGRCLARMVNCCMPPAPCSRRRTTR